MSHHFYLLIESNISAAFRLGGRRAAKKVAVVGWPREQLEAEAEEEEVVVPTPPLFLAHFSASLSSFSASERNATAFP